MRLFRVMIWLLGDILSYTVHDIFLHVHINNIFFFFSLIPYTNHPLVLKSAIKFGKNVVTTSYVSPAMREFHDA